jgi:ubiquinone/menaquinone biosynthesis C-methylase UbiE
MEAAEQFRERQKATWSAGDWPGFAPIIQEVADQIVDEIGVDAGQDYLDVATGSGNAAMAAAAKGARVTGLDFVPALVEAARARAAAAGVEAEFVEGDAEDLPFADDSFDRVTSIFGAMFAPRHQRAADELARVTRPGGIFAVTAWTPEGLNGEMFKTLAAHMPPLPEGIVSPVMWGEEEYVRGLFSSSGLEVSCEKRMANFEFESAERWMGYLEQNLGPVVMAKAALEPQGKWEDARAELSALEDRYNEADDGSMRAQAEYLLTKVTIAG